MDYVMIFHANLNYAFLEPYKYEQVIRSSYEAIIDTFRDKCPDAKYTFEASGFTLDTMAELTPDVLAKLNDAIKAGQCEFMGSPYAHPMVANFPPEDGWWACEFAMRSYEKHLGFRPESAWNPECSWMQYVPQVYADAGFKYLTLDFESFMICNRPEYGWVERNRRRDMSWGGNLPHYKQLDPNEPALHFPFKDVVPGLDGFARSDRLAGKSIGYFLGRLSLEDYIENMQTWSGDRDEGALIILADDAEYTGTTAYFYVKHFNEYDKSFSVDPTAGEKLERLVKAVTQVGPMITFKDACQLPPVKERYFVEDRFAWHRTYADVWANTPESKRFDPIVAVLRQELLALAPAAKGPKAKELTERVWFHLTNAENSDGRWPPPPGRTCPFNVEWVERELHKTRGYLDELRTEIARTDPAATQRTDACGHRSFMAVPEDRVQ